jgi:UDP-glucose 4-epimerase
VPGVEGVGEVVSDAAGGTAAALSRVFDRIQP